MRTTYCSDIILRRSVKLWKRVRQIHEDICTYDVRFDRIDVSFPGHGSLLHLLKKNVLSIFADKGMEVGPFKIQCGSPSTAKFLFGYIRIENSLGLLTEPSEERKDPSSICF